MEAISVKNLSIKYKDLLAVDNISFSIKEGEIFGIIGPNGAGKTSTLECMEGLRTAKSGQVSIFGFDSSQRDKFYKRVGVQLQETKLQDNMKVSEIISLYKSFYSDSADGDELLHQFGVFDKKNTLIKKLSGGQRQKLAIILALIGKPDVLILDEISTGLDPHARLHIWEKIRELRDSGKTILMTTHFMEEAEKLCDRVCLLADGKIKAMGTLDELIKQAHMPIKITVTAQKSELKKINLSKIPTGIQSTQVDDKLIVEFFNPKLLTTAIRWLCDGIEVDDINIYKPNLEDVFFKLTGSNLEATK